MQTSKIFRNELEKDKLTFRPCAYDCISAMVLRDSGFKIVGTSGYAISASHIGKPDVGLLGFEGMLDACSRIIESIPGTPVDIDADTGYGDSVNVYYTTGKFIRAEAAGIRIEDQGQRKMCGHLTGGSIISMDEMVGKIRAACRARDESDDLDFVIGARTDSIRVGGFDEALQRVIAYGDAGADYVYVEAPDSLEKVKQLIAVSSVPIAFNYIYGGKKFPFTFEQLEEVGVRYLSLPMIALYPATFAMQQAVRAFREGLETENQVTWGEFNTFIGMDQWRNLEAQL